MGMNLYALLGIREAARIKDSGKNWYLLSLVPNVGIKEDAPA